MKKVAFNVPKDEKQNHSLARLMNYWVTLRDNVIHRKTVLDFGHIF